MRRMGVGEALPISEMMRMYTRAYRDDSRSGEPIES